MEKRSLTRKLTVYPLLVGVVPLVVGLLIIYFTALTSQRLLVGNNFQSVAEETATGIDLIIEREVKAIKTLASDPEIHALAVAQSTERAISGAEREKFVKTTTEHFLNFVADNPNIYKEIVLTDGNGDTLTTTRGPSEQNFRDTEWWQAAFSDGHGANYVSDFHFIGDTEQADLDIATFFTHVVPEGGEKVTPHADGVIRVTVDAGALLKPVVYGVRIGETGHAMLISSDGKVRLCSKEPLAAHNIDPELQRLVTHSVPSWALAPTDGHGKTNSIIGTSPLDLTNQLGGQSLGGHQWFIFVRQDPTETLAPIYTTLSIVLVIGASLIFLFLLIGHQIARRLLGPIRVLQEGAATIGRGSLSHRIEIKSGDELESLATRFNEMAVNLQSSQKRLENWNEELEKEVAKRTVELQEAHRKLNQAFIEQKQFISDASHELRTPITIIQGHLELLKEAMGKKSKKNDLKAVDIALTELERMGRLLENMLLLARASQADFLVFEEIPISPFLEEVLIKAKGLASREWKLEVGTEGHLAADRDKLTQLFLNLIQNSINHTKARDTISLKAGEQDGWIQFLVKDTGAGIPEKELPKIFKRFYRVDKARTRESGHAGLGLSIVEAIVDAHGGRIEVESEFGRGTQFTVWFPKYEHDKGRS